MRFKNIYQNLTEDACHSEAVPNEQKNNSLNEAHYYEPKYMGKQLYINPDQATSGLKHLGGQTITIIEKPKRNAKVIEIIGTAKEPGFDNPVFIQATDGLIYKLINVAHKPFKVISLNKKTGKKLKYNIASKTAVQESAVCHTLALALKNKLTKPEAILEYFKNTPEDVMAKDFLALQNRYDCDSDVSNTIILVKFEPIWAKSVSATVARIIKEFKIKPASVFHRGTLDSQIKSHGADLAGVGTQPDKWNPADIMIIKKGSKEVKKFLATDNLNDANSIINNNVGKGTYNEILGISLKQSVYPKAVLKYFNMSGATKTVKADTAGTSEKGKKGFTKSTKLIDTKGGIEIDFRSTSGNDLSTISGKIKGVKALGGSMTVNELFKRNNVPLPKLSKDPSDYFTADNKSTPAFYNIFQTLINDALANVSRIGIKKLKGFLFSIKTKDALDKYLAVTIETKEGNQKNQLRSAMATMYAKQQGLYMLSIIKKDDFPWTYYQASAQTEINPAFVKVGE